MGRVIVVTAAGEGGHYSPDKSPSAPIRIYSDRSVEDDIAARFTGKIRRERLSRRDFRMARRWARKNRVEGRV